MLHLTAIHLLLSVIVVPATTSTTQSHIQTQTHIQAGEHCFYNLGDPVGECPWLWTEKGNEPAISHAHSCKHQHLLPTLKGSVGWASFVNRRSRIYPGC